MGLRTRVVSWAGRRLLSTWDATGSRARADAPAAGALPGSDHEIAEAARRCRAMVHRQSLFAAGASALPIPGLDLMTDVATLVKLIASINDAFGLTPAQIERLAPTRKLVVYKAISAGGGLLIGRRVTRAMVMRALQVVGVRLTAQQAAKWVPIAGQAVSAALTYSSLRYVCSQHIRQCIEVARQLVSTVEAAPASDA